MPEEGHVSIWTLMNQNWFDHFLQPSFLRNFVTIQNEGLAVVINMDTMIYFNWLLKFLASKGEYFGQKNSTTY